MAGILIGNRFFLCQNYIHRHSPPSGGKAMFSLRNVRRINYEADKKQMDIQYFTQTHPDTVVIHNVEECTFDAIATHMLSQDFKK